MKLVHYAQKVREGTDGGSYAGIWRHAWICEWRDLMESAKNLWTTSTCSKSRFKIFCAH